MATKQVAAEQFIEAWQTSNSVDEVAQKTGMRRQTCASRASTYRKRGVPLKHMPHPGARNLNWDKLAEYARSFKTGE